VPDPHAILEAARAGRKPPSRGLWIVALAIGVACTIAFFVVLFADGTATTPPRSQQVGSDRFLTGIVLGLAGGIAIGFAIAKRRRDQAADSHSERNRP
jgi:hypothetical protein